MEIQKKRLESQIRKLNTDINEIMKKFEKLKEKELNWNARESKILKEKDHEIFMRLKCEDQIKYMQQENEKLQNDFKKTESSVPEE